MKQRWTITNKPGDVNTVAREQGILPVTARVLLNRNLDTKEKRDAFLHPAVSGLRDCKKLLNAEKAAEILKAAIEEHKKIRIVGDYDVDGITSTYVLYSCLKEQNADISYCIPNRITDGYGINNRIVEDAICDKVNVLLTCDNGIAAYDTIKYACDNGMTVVLTDHHEVPFKDDAEILPPADVIVNPHQKAETNEFTGYCGCVVAMKVMEAMGADITKFLPYAAMATLCDVMDLQDENRTIVVRGLELLKKSGDIGLNALIRANSLEKKDLSAYHIGFVVGPCLNASGRLDTAEKALKMLITSDVNEAKNLSIELVALNSERKKMTEDGVKKAVEIIENKGSLDPVLVVHVPDCHESVAGIIAGRVREKYARPTFILIDSEECVKGSGRSTEYYSMFAEMMKVSDLFIKFGGHPMAAGLSIERARVAEMSERLNKNCTLTEEELKKHVKIDVKLPFEYVSERLVTELEMLSPFGKGNEKPLFAEKNLRVDKAFLIGKTERKFLKFNFVNATGYRFTGIYFGDPGSIKEMIAENFGENEWNNCLSGKPNKVVISATYFPEKNEYNGFTSLQAKIEDMYVF